MSQTQVQVNVEQEVSSAMDALVSLVAAIKANKVDLATELGVAIKLIKELPQVPADFQGDLEGSLNSCALGVVKLVKTLVS